MEEVGRYSLAAALMLALVVVLSSPREPSIDENLLNQSFSYASALAIGCDLDIPALDRAEAAERRSNPALAEEAWNKGVGDMMAFITCGRVPEMIADTVKRASAL